MSQRTVLFVNDRIYHVYNRGVRKSDIFLNNSDYRRWEELLYWCLNYNYTYSMYITRLRQARASGKDPQQITAEIKQVKRFDQPPVEILAYVHMPNHFHFILKQITDNGITSFMHRIGTSYSKYFNERHQLSGSLYQGKFQAKRVNTDEQLIHLFRYVHINPLSAGLISKQKLTKYPWSSLPSFVNRQKNKICTKKYLLDYFDNPDKLIKFTLAPFEKNAVDEIEKITIDDDFDWYREKRIEKKSYIKKALRKSI